MIRNPNIPSVNLIDIDQLLDDSSAEAYQKLLDAGFSKKEIGVCLGDRPWGRYSGYVDDQHPLLFDDMYRWDIAILRHIQSLKSRISGEGQSTRDWISHGYALAWMHFNSAGPDRVKETISQESSRRTKDVQRGRNPFLDKVIRLFRSEYESTTKRDIARFGHFIGEERQFDELGIEVLKSRNEANRITYIIKKIGDDENYEYVTRDSLNRRLKDFESGKTN